MYLFLHDWSLRRNQQTFDMLLTFTNRFARLRVLAPVKYRKRLLSSLKYFNSYIRISASQLRSQFRDDEESFAVVGRRTETNARGTSRAAIRDAGRRPQTGGDHGGGDLRPVLGRDLRRRPVSAALLPAPGALCGRRAARRPSRGGGSDVPTAVHSDQRVRSHRQMSGPVGHAKQLF